MTSSRPEGPADRRADLEACLAIARECAAHAGELLLDHFGAAPSGVRAKSGPRDLVSSADLAAEGVIRAILRRRARGDGVLGEEEPETRSETGRRWVVDPLDGTTNFLRRIPHWSVSIALEDELGPLVGVVHDPPRGEWFTATRGCGSANGGTPLTGSDATDLRLATVGGEFSARSAAQAECSRRLVSAVGHVRSYGSAALDLAWAAAGRFDAVYHGRFPSPWDLAAGSLLCREAGLEVDRLPAPGEREGRLLVAPPPLTAGMRILIDP
jgi:myo-inositol-1(or 4)-monophosphatase